MQIHNCKIEIVDDENVVYHNVKESPYEAPILVNGLTRELLKRWDQWVGNDRLNEREDLVLLGLHLYNILFPP